MTGAPRFSGGVIYAFADPESSEIRYVGKTSRYPASRLAAHREAARNGANTPLHQWLRELSGDPTVLILERDPFDRDQAEKDWIRMLRARGATLLNVQDGGTGWTPGLPQSEESNQARRKAVAGRSPNEGQLEGLRRATEAARAPEVRRRAAAAISVARKGKRYADNPHGTRQRYRQGCGCEACRGANAAYQRARSAAKKSSD